MIKSTGYLCDSLLESGYHFRDTDVNFLILMRCELTPCIDLGLLLFFFSHTNHMFGAGG